LPTRPHGAIVSRYMISRRGFLGGSVALLAAPLAVEAQQAGLTIPPSLLLRADQVIE